LIEEAKFYGVPSLIGALVVPPVGSVVRYGTYQQIGEGVSINVIDNEYAFELIMWEGTVMDFDYMARTWTIEVTMESRNDKKSISLSNRQGKFNAVSYDEIQGTKTADRETWKEFSLMDEPRVDHFQQMRDTRFFDPMITTKEDLFLVLAPDRYQASHGLDIGSRKSSRPLRKGDEILRYDPNGKRDQDGRHPHVPHTGASYRSESGMSPGWRTLLQLPW